MPKYDVIIKSAEKDYPKLGHVIDSLTWLVPQPERIYVINRNNFIPQRYMGDPRIVVLSDDEVFPKLDRDLIPYRKDWIYSMFMGTFQTITKNDYYLDVQGDNFFINPVHLFTEDGKAIFFVSPQHNHFHQPYFTFSKEMWGIDRFQEDSYIIDFMMYHKNTARELLDQHGGLENFFKKACEIIDTTCYPAEQEYYPHWAMGHHPELYTVQKEVNVLMLGKRNPMNYTEEDITSILKERYSPELLAISCHTWTGGVQGSISLVSDTIGRSDINALCEWLQQDPIPRLTKGALTTQLEQKWAYMCGTKYSVFVNSGSSAILLALAALKLRFDRKPKIVVPAVSWATDVSSPMLLGYDIILCDCNLRDLSCDLGYLEVIFDTERPDVFLSVAPLGLVPNMEYIRDLCIEYGVIFIEDNCESMGSKRNGKMLGTFGDMSLFSMYFGHHLSTIEGGFVNTDNEEIYKSLICMRSHGWDRDLDVDTRLSLRKQWNVDSFQSLYTFYMPGLNLRSTDLQAFIGLRALDNLPAFAEKRNSNFHRYLNGIKHNQLDLSEREGDFVSNFAYPIVSEKRDVIVNKLQEFGVETRPLIAGNMAKAPFWIKQYGQVPYSLVNADLIHKYGFYLPNHQGLPDGDVDFIIEIVNKYS